MVDCICLPGGEWVFRRIATDYAPLTQTRLEWATRGNRITGNREIDEANADEGVRATPAKADPSSPASGDDNFYKSETPGPTQANARGVAFHTINLPLSDSEHLNPTSEQSYEFSPAKTA